MQMASHHVAIAKASFSAGLLRPDPTSVPRDEITAFHSSLDRALSHCSPANIQTCKLWLLNYVVSSSNRVGVWAKYLVALSSSFSTEEDGLPSKRTEPLPGASVKRKRLHMLYLLNDLFHHTKYHLDSTVAFSTFSGSLQPYIVELLGHAASYDRQKYPKHHKRLDDLLDIWDDHGYYGSDYVNKLREVIKNAASSGPITASTDGEQNNAGPVNKFPGKDIPFVMPATHGDLSTPYYDLPAGNLVPHIIPDTTIPLRPDTIKPLQFLAGPADEKLVTALKAFLKDVDRIYESGKPEQKEDEIVDIDELGETVIRDAITSEILDGETYYGWSRSFCQQMKKRYAKDGSRNRSRSRTPSKRRRYSGSSESDNSRWGSSRSRSGSPPRKREGRYDSRSRTRSGSPQRSPSREKSYSPRGPSPPPSFPSEHQPHPYGNAPRPGFIPPPYPQAPPPPPMHLPPGGPPPAGLHAFPPGMTPGAPPPPPHNYQGQWPPPPPPMPMPMPTMNFPPQGPGMNTSAFPPPFPAQGQQQFPPWNMGPGQQMPPGSYHFPPPHSGGQGRGNQGPWGQYGGGNGGYPPSGRGWR